MFNPAIFKLYDIRGIYGKDFDDEFAFEFGKKVASVLQARTMLVGHDVRSSSAPLAKQLIQGILNSGTDVIFIGETTTPMFYAAVRALGADFGFMVTSSHNPGEYNGFKLSRKDGSIIDGMEMKELWGGPSAADGHKEPGKLEKMDFSGRYMDNIISVAGNSQIKISVAIEGPPMAKRNAQLLANYYGFNIDDSATLKVIFDPDGDRIHFTEQGIHIPSEFIFLAYVAKYKPAKVVCELRFSRSILEAMDTMAVPYSVARVGRPYIYAQMKKENADFGGETSGHFYFKEFGGLEAPEYMLVAVLAALPMTGNSLREFMAPYMKYLKSEEINIPLNGREWDDILAILKTKYSSHKLTELDGLTVDAWDDPSGGWWCNVRPSHTEPLVRLVVEAKDRNTLEKKVIEVRDTID